MRKSEEQTKPDILSVYAQVDEIVEKTFLHHINKYEIVPVSNKSIDVNDVVSGIRLFKLEKIVFDAEEDILDKLTSVYNTVHSLNGDLVMILHSNGGNVELYLGTKYNGKHEQKIISSGFEQSFNGNFPGCVSSKLKNSEVASLFISNIFTKTDKAVSAANGIPHLKDDDKDKFTQGLEKFIEAMQGKTYTALLIADAIDSSGIAFRRNAYENIYSALFPFSSQEISFGSNESETVTNGLSKSFTKTINESLSKTNSHTEGKNSSDGTTSTDTGGLMLGGMGGGFMGGVNYSHSSGKSKNNGISSSDTKAEARVNGSADSEMNGENSSDSKMLGTSETYQIKNENKTVKNLLEKIDAQIKRIDESEDYGMYDFAAYFISDDYDTTRVAASTYKAVMRGDESSVEKSSIVSWDIKTSRKMIIPYLKQLTHPKIILDNKMEVTPTTLISSKELALAMNLPRKAVKGVVVTESVEFGRDVHLLDKTSIEKSISLGCTYHLGKEEKSGIALDLQSLSMHALITGSTGSGKSNTIYTILDKLVDNGIKFLIIEPAKGEYKDVFGGRADVKIFGSNPKYSELLKINPFSFHDEIHVLEHIDRVIEIFNASWPMYAAMPSILKDAVVKSYIACGWDIDYSICIGEKKYPTFSLLLSILDDVIESSQYADELKSNYKGALLTRIKALTIGLSGQIFTDSEVVKDDVLFDSNVIIDLSRIGSLETKSLIMGMLMLRLIEYRSSNKKGSNSTLKHVTVLEEAHNLLKRTSTEQSGESSNLQGKAVEMLSNAIAEMRTYGEGFIIADQSPNMLDVSAIRNTGTKIIMRLPEFADRNDIGKSAALNEKQIAELPKLATGVAVVYQNNWLEAVLCKVDKFSDFKAFAFESTLTQKMSEEKKNLGNLLTLLLQHRVKSIADKEVEEIDIEVLQNWNSFKNCLKPQKNDLLTCIENFEKNKDIDLFNEHKYKDLSKLIYDLVDGNKILTFAKYSQDLNEYDNKLSEIIRHYVDTQNNVLFEDAIKQSILSHESKKEVGFKELYFSWIENKKQNKGEFV